MQRPDRDNGELLDNLTGAFQRLRQGGIVGERFDFISGFEALGGKEE